MTEHMRQILYFGISRNADLSFYSAQTFQDTGSGNKLISRRADVEFNVIKSNLVLRHPHPQRLAFSVCFSESEQHQNVAGRVCTRGFPLNGGSFPCAATTIKNQLFDDHLP